MSFLTHNDQLWLQRFEVNDVKGTDKHSQGDEQHRRANAKDKQFKCQFLISLVRQYQQDNSRGTHSVQRSETDTCSLHAVEDEAEEDEGVVAVVRFHVFHHSLTHLSKVAGFWKLALVYERGPGSDGHTASVHPLLSRRDGQAFREPDPVRWYTEDVSTGGSITAGPQTDWSWVFLCVTKKEQNKEQIWALTLTGILLLLSESTGRLQIQTSLQLCCPCPPGSSLLWTVPMTFKDFCCCETRVSRNQRFTTHFKETVTITW